MNERRLEAIIGFISNAGLSVFVLGLAFSISSGFAGFWGGLPFWVIAVVSLSLVWFDYWDSCLRRK